MHAATKCIERASAVIPAELRQPGVNSLVLACSTDSRGDGSSLKAAVLPSLCSNETLHWRVSGVEPLQRPLLRQFPLGS